MALSIFKSVRSLVSKLDRLPGIPMAGKFEARYVQLSSSHFSAYVSSHREHVSADGIPSLVQATLETYLLQVDGILKHYDEFKRPVDKMHVNFMGKGDPLMNATVLNHFSTLYEHIRMRSLVREIDTQVNIGTIMPKSMSSIDLHDVFGTKPVRLCYSLFSIENAHIDRMDLIDALDKLKGFQDRTGQPVTFHWPLFAERNDDPEKVHNLSAKLRPYSFKGKINLVRHGPPRTEDHRLNEAFDIIKQTLSDTGCEKCKVVVHDVDM